MTIRRGICAVVLGILILLLLATGVRGLVWVEVDGLRVELFHTAAEFQCAAEVVGNISFDDDLVTVLEEDVSEAQADCICDFDLRFGFELPAPGLYLLQLWHPRPPFLVGEFWIDADGSPAGAPPTVLQSSCGGWATHIPDPPPRFPDPSFSLIKSRY
jgi:hypothetical protein